MNIRILYEVRIQRIRRSNNEKDYEYEGERRGI
jgi:hypothetical protein